MGRFALGGSEGTRPGPTPGATQRGTWLEEVEVSTGSEFTEDQTPR